MIKRLLKLANKLDQKGYHKEANLVDGIIKVIANASALTKALKDGDQQASMSALTGLMRDGNPARDLRMTDDEFRWFANALRSGDLEMAKEMYGIEMGVDLTDTSKYNPVTGQPWSSGPVQTTQQQGSEGELRDLVRNIVQFVRSRGGKVVRATGEGEDNMLRLEFGGLSEDSQKEFGDVFGGGAFKDNVYGYVHYVGGIIDDGPLVGIELESIPFNEDKEYDKSILSYIKDLLKG